MLYIVYNMCVLRVFITYQCLPLTYSTTSISGVPLTLTYTLHPNPNPNLTCYRCRSQLPSFCLEQRQTDELNCCWDVDAISF